MKEILDTAGWSSERTFDRFYNKPFQVVLLHLCSQLTNWNCTSLSPLNVGDLKVSVGFNTLLS